MRKTCPSLLGAPRLMREADKNQGAQYIMANTMMEGNSVLWGQGEDRQTLPQRRQERSNKLELSTHR